MRISIVTTLFHSAPYVEEFYRRARAAVEQLTDDYEIVVVNDGSPDDALDRALQLRCFDGRVKVVDLSRNFGHHRAMLCGLGYASGDEVFLIDCDLEEAPEWLVDFHEQMARERCDVVYGVQERRRGGYFDRASGALFYAIVRHLCDLETPANRTSAMLMTKGYVRALLRFDEREPVFLGLSVLAGFDQRPRYVNKTFKGRSTYTLTKRVAATINLVTAFSSRPLVYIFYFGTFISTGAMLYSAALLVRRLFFEKPLDGWTSVMMSIWVLGGLIICFIGVVGIYLSRVFAEAKRRPNVIVRMVVGETPSQQDAPARGDVLP